MAEQNRTEKATPKRRQRATDQGNLVRSREVSSAISLGGCFMGLVFAGPLILKQAQTSFTGVLTYVLQKELTPSSLSNMLWVCAYAGLRLVGPIMLAALVLAVIGSGLQHGFHWTFTPMAWNFGRLNPAANLGRIFSINGLGEFVKSLLIFGVISYMAWSVVQSELYRVPGLVLMSIPQIVLLFGTILYRISLRIVLFMLVIAVADFFFQKYRYEAGLKMTKHEVKEEAKESEGNPMIKGKIRRVGRDLLRRYMMRDVPKADVVITNPTEYAVAIQYDMDQMAAPRVVAKGRGYIAARIRAIAGEHKIPIVENPPLARALYKMVEVGQEIPAELYKTVAEILAYIYRLKAMRG